MIATEPQTANIPGERKLLCELIKLAALDARNGVVSAQRFFQSTMFTEVCFHLGLSGKGISTQVLATIGEQQARTRGSDIAPRKSRKRKALTKIEGNWTSDISAISAWTTRAKEDQ